ncbi:hypothetical protein IscW_ISCW009890, partial [Ixodes scapularis]
KGFPPGNAGRSRDQTRSTGSGRPAPGAANGRVPRRRLSTRRPEAVRDPEVRDNGRGSLLTSPVLRDLGTRDRPLTVVPFTLEQSASPQTRS